MITSDVAIYAGHVVHKRLRPKPHALRYRVFSLLIDVAAIDDVARRVALFSHNRFNVFSFYDKDHGPGDGTPASEVARQCLNDAGRPYEGRRVLLLSYPRIFGYVFNPLSVFYVYAPSGALETYDLRGQQHVRRAHQLCGRSRWSIGLRRFTRKHAPRPCMCRRSQRDTATTVFASPIRAAKRSSPFCCAIATAR